MARGRENDVDPAARAFGLGPGFERALSVVESVDFRAVVGLGFAGFFVMPEGRGGLNGLGGMVIYYALGKLMRVIVKLIVGRFLL